MDVDRHTFHWQLPSMLRALAGAHFVAVDFELSGIQSKTMHRVVPTGNRSHGGKQTLQQRYEEAREAAERYQILQVGLTIVKEDLEAGNYMVRPYNFYLNPIPEVRLDIERIFSFQSGAVEFLLKVGFDMAGPFMKGVPYLSREEEITSLQLEMGRQDKNRIADIHLKDDEMESIKFVRQVRADIEKWKSQSPRIADYLNIAPEGHAITQNTERGLNNYQKRLVHQLVRAEYPDLVTISRPGFIQIIPYNQKREDDIVKARMRSFEEKLTRQVGIRWLVEGMVGGDLEKIDPIMFVQSFDGVSAWIDVKEMRREFDEVKGLLKQKHAVLVGHNLFMDLINFYKCFFGKLPERLEDFQAVMHTLFPMIVDTKYMATHNNSDINARSGLDELDKDLHTLLVPKIEMHPEHSKYDEIAILHEAGYDSLMTAKVLIRLSAKLEVAGHYVDSEDDGWHTPPEDGGVLLNHTNDISSSKVATAYPAETVKARSNGHQPMNSDSSGQGVSITVSGDPTIQSAERTTHTLVAVKSKSSKQKKAKKAATKAKTAFAHAGMFDLLQEESGDGNEDVDENLRPTARPGIHSRSASSLAVPEALSVEGKAATKMMPPWKSDFWNVYGNKLRVNGTVEGICDMTGC